jgi:Mlc titration factor MtfA (ptsG expression regulator)
MDFLTYLLVGGAILILLIYLLKGTDWDILAMNKSKRIFSNDSAPIFRVIYKMLDEKGRKKFEKRVCRFIRMKNFRAGKNVQAITDEMRLMVAASAIQLTYGYPNVYFQHFQNIILYDQEYYAASTGQYHQGEVNALGAIVLSWNNFEAGFSDMTDGRNLALHEMAHALRLTNILDNEEYDFIDRGTMREFEQIALLEMKKIEDKENQFFRIYGATNLQEFFAVAVECFFELPLEFRNYNPRLYQLMTMILRVDLLNFRE